MADFTASPRGASPRRRTIFRAGTLGAALLWNLGGGLEAQQIPAELSLEEALSLAERNNPDFIVQASQVETADRQIRAARGDFLPTMNLSNSYGYQASGERRAGSVVLGVQPQYYSSSYSMNVSYSMNGATLLRPGQARTEAEAARARVMARFSPSSRASAS